MFRRKEDTMEPDASFPADLKKLGFFINNTGHIRMINAPEKPFLFQATNNDRVNEVRREAMQVCQRREVEARLASLGLSRIHLPTFTKGKPNGPHVPILAPVLETLKTRKRIVVLVNSTMQDLGILSYRELQRDLGINGGSIVNFVKEVIKRSTNNIEKQNTNVFEDGYRLEDDSLTPGLIATNTAQFLYSHKYNQAMTLSSWSAMPRKSISHDMIRIHDKENYVQGHRNAKEHVKTVFDQIICNSDRVAADAEVYVVAIEDGTEHVLNLLADDFEKYGTRITAMALIHSQMDDSQIADPQLRAFLHQRARQWRINDLTSNPLHCTDLPKGYEQNTGDYCRSQISKHIVWHEEIPKGSIVAMQKTLHRLSISITTPDQVNPAPSSLTASGETAEYSSTQAVICPTFSSGPNTSSESILTHPLVQHAILSFFEQVSQDPENYRNKNIRLCKEASKATPEHPIALFAEDPDKIGMPLSNEDDNNNNNTTATMTIEQAELHEAKEELKYLNKEFKACPDDVSELKPGREKLAAKIAKLESRIQDMIKKEKENKEKEKEEESKASEEEEAGQQTRSKEWKADPEGAKVPFAGAMVDSELLRAAGLMDSE